MNYLRRNWIAVGFVAIGTLFLCDAYASDPRDLLPYILNHAVVKSSPGKAAILEWERQYNIHQIQGETAFCQAKDLCRWFCNNPKMEKVLDCFESAEMALGNHTPSTRLVNLVRTLIARSGVETNDDDWEDINEKLYWAEYHFEIADHYKNLLDSQ